MKPKIGWLTSEFFLSLVAVAGAIYTGLVSQNILSPQNEVVKIISVVMGVLAAAGYSFARSWVKASAQATPPSPPPVEIPPPA
jgi:hypothetical protein